LALAAARFPQVSFLLGHSGSTDFKADAAAVVGQHSNVYAESSLTRPFGAASLLDALGDERVIMGSAAPLNDLVFEWRETLQLLPPARFPGFYGGAVASLLREVHG